MKYYKADKNGPTTYLVVGCLVALALILFYGKGSYGDKSHWYFLFGFPLGMGFWSIFQTYYKIKDDKLIYRSGFIQGEIDIGRIKEIIKGKTRWVGVKAALATGGIIVKYNRFDDVYIAPKNQEELIGDLLKLNGDIVVTENNPDKAVVP